MTMSVNSNNQLLVAQGNSPFTEANRNVGIWSTITATPFTTVAAVPTTAAALEIWNNSGSQTMEILDIFGFQLLSTAVGQAYGLWAQVGTKASPSVTALAVWSQSGKPGYTSGVSAPVITGVGTTVVTTGWRPYGPVGVMSTGVATPAASYCAEVHGKIIVPPGASVMITAAGSLATASSFHVGASWHFVTQVNQ